MSAQRYRDPMALARMAEGSCPECGGTPAEHINDARFWLPRRCDLMPHGVTDRIEQYRADAATEAETSPEGNG